MNNNENAKRKTLHNVGLNFIQKKLLRKILANLGSVSLALGCKITSCIISVQPQDKDNYNILVKNSENSRFIDITQTAEEMSEAHPLAKTFFKKILVIIDECVEFWNTPVNNIEFIAWTEGTQVKAAIKPIQGFKDYEKIDLA